MMTTRVKTIIAPVFAGLLVVFALVLLVQPAFASTRDDLKNNYQSAVINYESAVDAQGKNATAIAEAEAEIADTERKIAETQEQLNETAVVLYKTTRGGNVLVELLLNSNGFQDAVIRYDQYERISRYYREKAEELATLHEQLAMHKRLLEKRKAELDQEVAAAEQAAFAAAELLRDNMHTDGANYHQVQGNGSNCGATAFIVGVNILLHDNRFVDNVAVWNGDGFNGDSTSDLAWKGSNWLVANGLFEQISIETVPGDIHTAAEMREWLEDGYVVIVSSGSGSTWKRADGVDASENSFPDGHWIVFYCYNDGVFYANDSSVAASKGAGCPYTEEEMQQWLDGRSNHFATAMKKR